MLRIGYEQIPSFDRRTLMERPQASWPDLTYSTWRETVATLHLFTQIVGKIRLAMTPWVNHSWQVPLYVTPRGLSTSPIPIGAEILEIEFDFVSHRLAVRTSAGDERIMAAKAATGRRLLSRSDGYSERHGSRRSDQQDAE